MNTENEILCETIKPKVHFTDNDLLFPTNPIKVNLIGAGGTGSQMLMTLARMNPPVQKSIATNVKDFNFTKSICCYEKIFPFNTY